MKNSRKRGLFVFLAITILVTSIASLAPGAMAATSNNIKVGDYIRIVVQAAGIEVDTTKSSPYLKAALKAGIVKDGDFKDYKEYLTRTDAAVILNRADEYLYGDTVESKLLKTILESRISDVSKIAKDKREAVGKVYAKGFIKGYSNGYYIKSREFRGSEYMTVSGARSIVAMLKDTKKRSKVSPDGQVIRTTNLPKNAKDYEYILETYPNSFYEMKFSYQNSKYYFEPKELIHYASPARLKDVKFNTVDVNKYKDTWMEKVEINLKNRLNVDYRTIDNKWLNTLRSTYTPDPGPFKEKKIMDDLKKYVAFVKKNKVVIQSKVISVEPSTLYMKGAGFYVRAYIKFKVDYSGTKLTAEDLICGDHVYMPELKKGTWYEGVYDIEIGSIVSGTDGIDYYVTNDSLNDYFYKGK